ncbi:putative uncharacterized protein DDB_G0277255 isoform X2 [Drosophila virilis]|uniref:Uncharacterized protein, isoform D n=1 Tax=Drosophila virilis TaxID=7244 RepID=B4LKG6_DROVI|nr:homeobox protein 5 isoform X2 [Drosophila virilis]EDW60687.2 uncharacterized protein Dvir_GJ20718, isoform D [Drosophila virilis]
MSKKMWHKIFKSKAQKQQQQLNKINKRHSRGIYEEYQQLNELLNGEKSPVSRFCSENENENGNNNSNSNNNCSSGSGNINVFEQQPQQSSFNSAALSEAQQQQQPLPQQQQQSQHLSTFSRVRNTFSLRRNNNNNNNSSSSNNKKQTPNAKSTTMESDGADDDKEPVGPPPGPLTTGMSETILEQGAISTDLTPCPNCSRTFNLNALRKHVVVCEKMTTKKRKIFDSSRQRREGTSLSTYVLPKNFGLPNAEKAPGVHTPPAASREASTMSSGSQPQEASPLPTRRKGKADTARASLRKGAGATAAAAEHPAAAAPAAPAAAAPPRSITKRLKDSASDRCPHCERSFNPKAYDRHVEWCKEKAIQANIKSNSTTETNKAKERMEARKQYRPPNLKTKRSINRDKYSGAQEEQYEIEMVSPKQNLMSLSSMTTSVQSVNGPSPQASDKYDPFLSAKRQLEELCSPNTPPDNEPLVNTTATPIMSTSLTSTLGKLHTTTPTATSTAPKATPISNFRRTSSLRGPRRTPLLPSRPLFASNYRPTIQRGLSDEGPISSNFLKPEEYDEMPVRAACGNDFHSPRVVRRDTSASNRKQQMKLPLGGGGETDSTTTSKQPTTRNVAKTDSLAVFLKYEHELEQLNAKAAEVAANSKELSSKELKDKSNNLSKQNSAKNLTANPNGGQLPPLTTPICPPVAKENNENVAHNFATPLRLEPLSKPPQNLVSPNTNNNSNNNNSGNAAPLPIKLESIFGSNRLGDYIDPKLINPCDNLNVQQSSAGSSDASSTPQQLSQSRSSSQSTITMAQEQRRHSGEARNLLKRKMRLGRNQFLYDASPEEQYISSGSCADDEANRSSLEFDEQCWQQQQKQLLTTNPLNLPNMPVLPTFDDFDFEEFLSSFENDNDEEQFPLFRDCREFLLNRTTSRQRSFQKATSTSQTQSQTQNQTQTQTQPQTPTVTQRPATTGNTSQFITPPKTHFYAPSTKETHAHRSDSNVSSSGGSYKSPQASCGSYKTTPNSSGSYKTPPNSNSSYKTPLTSSDEKLQRQQSNASTSSSTNNCHVEKSQKSLESESQKREIFISIETEPNAQGRSPISPDSLRHMVGNAQTPIDVLHIENGNEPEHAKFSKISDNEDQVDAELADETGHSRYKKRLSSTASAAAISPAPNVEANNAKNVIEKMRNDFKQLGEEVGASVRRDIMQRQEHAQQKQQMQAQQDLKVMTPSPSGDSDELSSLDGYPMSSSQSSRRGASSKLSNDSAYGSNSPYSLSRQRSSELQSNDNTPRTQSQLRPHTASGALSMSGKQSMMDASTQAASNYGTLKARQRMFAGNGLGGDTGDGNVEYSSSSSEHSLPVTVAQQPQQQQQQNTNYNYQQQQQQQQHQQQSQAQVAYNNNSNNNNNNNSYELNAKNLNNNNNNGVSVNLTPTTSQLSLHSNTSNVSSGMSSSMKMSKFCHECGAKFVIEHAKFCMDCGVRRVVL